MQTAKCDVSLMPALQALIHSQHSQPLAFDTRCELLTTRHKAVCVRRIELVALLGILWRGCTSAVVKQDTVVSFGEAVCQSAANALICVDAGL